MDWQFILKMVSGLLVIQLLSIPIGAILLFLIYRSLLNLDRRFEVRKQDFEQRQRRPSDMLKNPELTPTVISRWGR